jgi:hypothetical protein
MISHVCKTFEGSTYYLGYFSTAICRTVVRNTTVHSIVVVGSIAGDKPAYVKQDPVRTCEKVVKNRLRTMPVNKLPSESLNRRRVQATVIGFHHDRNCLKCKTSALSSITGPGVLKSRTNKVNKNNNREIYRS